MMRATAPVRCLICVAVLSCGDGSPSAGGDAADIPLTPTTEDVYTVGALSGEDWETFGNVTNLVFDEAGNLHIFDLNAKRIVVVDPEGNFVRTIGRQGEGPGEFSSPLAFTILGDGRMVVYDFPRTFHLFDQEGRFTEDVTFDLFAGVPGSVLIARPDHRLISRGGMQISRPGQESEDAEDAHLRDIDIFALDGSDREVLYRAWALLPTERDEELSSEDEQGREQLTVTMPRMRAFEPGLHLGMLSDGRLAVADSMGYRLKLISMDGTVAAIIERRVAPEVVTEAVKDAERARRTEAFSEMESMRVDGVGELVETEGLADQMAATMLTQVESMLFTDVVPAIADIAVDRTDLIWIERTGAGGAELGLIDLITADGDYLGTLPADGPRIPHAFGPDGLMAYIETGEFDVQIVRVIRVVPFETPLETG